MFLRLPLERIRSLMVRDLATGHAPNRVQQINKLCFFQPNNKRHCRMPGLACWFWRKGLWHVRCHRVLRVLQYDDRWHQMH